MYHNKYINKDCFCFLNVLLLLELLHTSAQVPVVVPEQVKLEPSSSKEKEDFQTGVYKVATNLISLPFPSILTPHLPHSLSLHFSLLPLPFLFSKQTKDLQDKQYFLFI